MNKNYQRSQKFCLFVNCEQHDKKHTNNTGTVVVTLSAIGSYIFFSATSVTCDNFSFKTTNLISTMNRF